jgi:hypothetical protein
MAEHGCGSCCKVCCREAELKELINCFFTTTIVIVIIVIILIMWNEK